MKSNALLISTLSCIGAAAMTAVMLGQNPAPASAPANAAAAAPQQGPGVQAANDARYRDWVTAQCKTPCVQRSRQENPVWPTISNTTRFSKLRWLLKDTKAARSSRARNSGEQDGAVQPEDVVPAQNFLGPVEELRPRSAAALESETLHVIFRCGCDVAHDVEYLFLPRDLVERWILR